MYQSVFNTSTLSSLGDSAASASTSFRGCQSFRVVNNTQVWLKVYDDQENLQGYVAPWSVEEGKFDQPSEKIILMVDTSQSSLPVSGAVNKVYLLCTDEKLAPRTTLLTTAHKS